MSLLSLLLQSLQGFFAQLVLNLILPNSSLLLISGLKKLWCQARVLLSLVSLATKMYVSKLIHYFSSHQASFGFWSSNPPDNITLNPANRKADQSHLEFQTGICAAAHATQYGGAPFLTSKLHLLILYQQVQL